MTRCKRTEVTRCKEGDQTRGYLFLALLLYRRRSCTVLEQAHKSSRQVLSKTSGFCYLLCIGSPARIRIHTTIWELLLSLNISLAFVCICYIYIYIYIYTSYAKICLCKATHNSVAANGLKIRTAHHLIGTPQVNKSFMGHAIMSRPSLSKYCTQSCLMT